MDEDKTFNDITICVTVFLKLHTQMFSVFIRLNLFSGPYLTGLFRADILISHIQKSTGVTNNINAAVVYLSVPLSHFSEPACTAPGARR